MPRKSDPKPKARKPRKLPPIETDHLTYKQRLFIEYYIGETDGNATEAARLAGYSLPTQQGPENLGKPRIKAAIAARSKLGGLAMTTDEILARWSDIGSADLGDFTRLSPGGYLVVDLSRAVESGKTHLIKKLKYGQFGPEIELHDPMTALEKLAKYRGLLKDRIEVETGEADPLKTVEAAAVLAELKRRNEGKSDGEEEGREEGRSG